MLIDFVLRGCIVFMLVVCLVAASRHFFFVFLSSMMKPVCLVNKLHSTFCTLDYVVVMVMTSMTYQILLL